MWLNPNIDMNTKLRQKATSKFEKYAFLRRIMESVNNRNEKKLYSIGGTLSYYNVVHRKFISYRNEKNSKIYK